MGGTLFKALSIVKKKFPARPDMPASKGNQFSCNGTMVMTTPKHMFVVIHPAIPCISLGPIQWEHHFKFTNHSRGIRWWQWNLPPPVTAGLEAKPSNPLGVYFQTGSMEISTYSTPGLWSHRWKGGKPMKK